MARFNDGLICTNENCMGCNKCISVCSVLGANIAVVKNGVAKVAVDSKKCTHCGKCITVCSHGARTFRDDTEDFFAALKSGKKLSVLLAPSFYLLYGEQAEQIIGYLKSLGVQKIYDVAFGAEISIWRHVKYLKDHKNESSKNRAFIANTCSALVNVIELYHPKLIDKLIPVHSPMVCTAIYAEKYLGDTNDMAFIGPCVSKKDEINSHNSYSKIKYNITFSHLMNKISGTDIKNYSAQSDLKDSGLGGILPMTGSFKECVSYFFPRTEVIVSSDGLTSEVLRKIEFSITAEGENFTPLLEDILVCKNGCQEGPGVEKNSLESPDVFIKYKELHEKSSALIADSNNYEENWAKIQTKFEKLDPNDFLRLYEDRYRQPFRIPSSTYNEIFNAMLKNTEEKRHVNCASCGYKTCKEMVTAIAYGYNKKENCIHYMKEEMMLRFYTDMQTGINNKIGFTKTVSELFKKYPEKKWILAIGDICRLSVVNELYGNRVGDAVLRSVAHTLGELVKGKGVCGRMGGGMFTLCMDYTEENLRNFKNIKNFECYQFGLVVPVVMRFGIFLGESNGSLESMLNAASLAIGSSSDITKNRFTLYTKEMKETALCEVRMTSQIREALEKDEFQLYFQPQFDAFTKKIVGAESLCRWIKPDGTMISPGLFIPVAEKNGHIRNLDKRIWLKAFQHMRHWLDSGMNIVPVSVNISRMSLHFDDFIATISALREKYRIPDDLIHFEITESAYMSDQGQLISKINGIRDLGYKIAMDDFGSGYSSLNSLTELPIDILKLDMGFMRKSVDSQRGSSIISHVIDMAHSLNLAVISEGVETEAQAEFLRNRKCDIIQGFLYAKPMPEDDFTKLLGN